MKNYFILFSTVPSMALAVPPGEVGKSRSFKEVLMSKSANPAFADPKKVMKILKWLKHRGSNILN